MTDHELPGQGSTGSDGDFDEVERQTRQLLHELGMRSQTRELSASDRRRTDAAARAALEEMLSAPRSVPDQDQDPVPDPTKKPHTMARRSRRRRWAVVGVSLAAAAAVALVLVPPAFDRAAPPAADSSRSADASDPSASSMQGPATPTPPMLDFPDEDIADRIGMVSIRVGVDTLLRQLARTADRTARKERDAADPILRVITEGWRLGDPIGASGDLLAIRSDRYLLADGVIRTVEHAGRPLDSTGRVPPAEQRSTGPVSRDESNASPRSCTSPGPCSVREMLASYADFPVPPALDGALWRALAQCDPADCGEVESLGRTVDRLGRPATGFRILEPGRQRELVVYADMATGAVLGVDEIATSGEPAPGVVAPAVIGFTAIVSAERVTPDRLPPADLAG